MSSQDRLLQDLDAAFSSSETGRVVSTPNCIDWTVGVPKGGEQICSSNRLVNLSSSRLVGMVDPSSRILSEDQNIIQKISGGGDQRDPGYHSIPSKISVPMKNFGTTPSICGEVSNSLF